MRVPVERQSGVGHELIEAGSTTEREIDLRKKIVATVIVCGWIVYVGTTAYVAWRLFQGDTPLFLKDYTLGTNAAWVTLGIMLWVATEWFRDGGD